MKRKSNAGYASAGLGLFDQLYINATGRIEAASTFGELSNNTFFYPSADIAWQFTQLDAGHDLSFLSFGKVRASYGIVGIQPQAKRFFVSTGGNRPEHIYPKSHTFIVGILW